MLTEKTILLSQSYPVFQFAITNTHNHAITETLSLMLNFFLFSNNILSYLPWNVQPDENKLYFLSRRCRELIKLR